MKIYRFLPLGTLILVIIFVLSGCSKDNAIAISGNEENLTAQIETLNQSYTNNPNIMNRGGKGWARIVAADVAGARGGAWLGGKIGAFFGNPLAGAIVGGIVVGAAGSYGVSSVEPPTEDFYDNVIAYKTQILESNNPYDEAGKRHNEILKEVIIKGYNNKVDNFRDVLTQEEIRFFEEEETFVSNTIYYFSDVNNTDIVNLVEWVNTNTEPGKTQNIITSFLETIYDFQDYNKYQSYIYDFEDLIINSDSLSEDDKNKILISSSVARYSGDFWHKVL